jgi:hypothetical protein
MPAAARRLYVCTMPVEPQHCMMVKVTLILRKYKVSGTRIIRGHRSPV